MNDLRILVTTDNHVGYNESDPIRGPDAANTFDEIMKIAKDRDVDLVLQAGDLFHVNRPSRESMYRVIKTLRTCCLGDKPCEVEVLNHGPLSADAELDHVNYEDPNINVAIPVFAINGNHDDAGGASMLSPMDVLSATGLINHFGRVVENDNITVTPVLLRKGTTKLALYGLSNVRDERLFRTFRQGNVKFLRPGEDADQWFNLIAVHQNHAAHSATSYLPEEFLPDFMHLVVWGHEHECLIEPTTNPDQGFKVIQPGSSVATSLSDGESAMKHVCILTISGTSFTSESIPLKTVRPFKMDTVRLVDSLISPGPDTKLDVTNWLRAKVDNLIEQANEEWRQLNPDIPEDQAALPLVRLRVDYSGGYEVENPTRFSNRFVGRVANVDDVVQYFRKKSLRSIGGTKKSSKDANDAPQENDTANLTLDNLRVQALVEEYLRTQRLEVLQETGLGEAISNFVDKDDKLAVKEFVDAALEAQTKNLLGLQLGDELPQNEAPVPPAPKGRKAAPKAQTAKGRAKSTRGRTVKSNPVVVSSDEEMGDDDVEILSDSDESAVVDSDSDSPPPRPTSKTNKSTRTSTRTSRPTTSATSASANRKTTAARPTKATNTATRSTKATSTATRSTKAPSKPNKPTTKTRASDNPQPTTSAQTVVYDPNESDEDDGFD
uniref:Double-strand break repair protein n=1 Tax=Blastobotrys adeninivorans TaxID=409370 RepID=A0A060TA40_BLAAD